MYSIPPCGGWLIPPSPPLSSLTSPLMHRFLICADIDITSCTALAEHCLQTPSLSCLTLDGLIVAGALCPEASIGTSAEEDGESIGVLTSVISQLENIVCRVVYTPGSSDPYPIRDISPPFSSESPRITPNSRNIMKQYLKLSNGLGILGYCEPLIVSSFEDIDGVDSDDDDDLLEEQRREATRRMEADISTLCANGVKHSEKGRVLNSAGEATSDEALAATGQCIVVSSFCPNNRDNGRETGPTRSALDDFPLLEYCKSESAQTHQVLHVASSNGTDTLDVNVGDVRVIFPGSLRKQHSFVLVELKLDEHRTSWSVDKVDFLQFT